MRICFVTAGSLADYENRAAEADIVCCGYQAIGQVSYERELKGETALFEDVAQLSKTGKNVVVCGCFTDARGIKRKSLGSIRRYSAPARVSKFSIRLRANSALS